MVLMMSCGQPPPTLPPPVVTYTEGNRRTNCCRQWQPMPSSPVATQAFMATQALLPVATQALLPVATQALSPVAASTLCPSDAADIFSSRPSYCLRSLVVCPPQGRPQAGPVEVAGTQSVPPPPPALRSSTQPS